MSIGTRWSRTVGLGVALLSVGAASAGFTADEKKPGDPAPATQPPKTITEKPPVRGQGTRGTPPPTTVLMDRDYHLGPGDLIEIVVEKFEEEFSKTTRLYSDGTFDYPILGIVRAAGLTKAELEAQLTEGLKQEIKKPVVHVTVKEIYVPPAPEQPERVIPKIAALGAVSAQGEMELPEPKMLRTLLARIGPTESADLASIRIRYPDGSIKRADFSRFRAEGTAEGDILIKGGEEIIILERPAVQKPDPIRVVVLGAVKSRGTVELEGDTSIIDVIAKAGGETPDADLHRVKVEGPNHPTALIVNVEEYMDGNAAAGYVAKSGDRIVVPEMPMRVLVVGEVPKQGEIAIREGETAHAVYLRSGMLPSGDEAAAEILRRGKDGKPVSTRVNLRDISKQRKPDVKLAAGDVLFIPRKKTKKGILYYLGAIASPLWLLRGPGTGILGQ